MTIVTYTDFREPNSSLVDGIYYDERTQELTVDLDNQIYRYSNVPKSVFDEFVTGGSYGSVGKFYTPEIKRKYGPGEYLGAYYLVDFDEVEVAGDDASVGTPKGLVYAPDAKVTTTTGGENYISLATTPPSTPAADLSRYEVEFAVGATVKRHTLAAESLVAAATGVETLGDMLGVTFEVVAVRKV